MNYIKSNHISLKLKLTTVTHPVTTTFIRRPYFNFISGHLSNAACCHWVKIHALNIHVFIGHFVFFFTWLPKWHMNKYSIEKTNNEFMTKNYVIWIPLEWDNEIIVFNTCSVLYCIHFNTLITIRPRLLSVSFAVAILKYVYIKT